MRTTFLREQKKVEASKSTGAAAADVYKPALWYYEHLMFLTENQKVRRDGVDSFDTEDSSTESERKGEKSKKKQIDVQSKQLKLLESAETLLLSQEDPTESLTKAMALQLKDMSKLQKCIAEKLISEIMFYDKLDQLTVNSFINLNAYRIASHHSSSPVNNYNSQTRRQVYMPMISPASESRYTPSPSQSPASHTFEHTAYNVINNESCNTVILSTPEFDSQPLPTENQTFSNPQSSDMPTRNQTSNHNQMYERNHCLSDFLVLNKKTY